MGPSSPEQRRLDAIGIGATLLAAAIAVVAFPALPDRVAIHWNAAGQADGYAPPTAALGLHVGLVAGLYLLHRFAPSVDALSSTLRAVPWAYDGYVAVLLGFLIYIEALVVAVNLGVVSFAIGAFLCPPLAVLYWALAVLMDRLDRNALVGVRTPWTLASERVWEATHDRAAPAFRVAAVLTLPGAAFSGVVALVFAVGPVLLASGYAVAYSFLAYRRFAPEDDEGGGQGGAAN